jgi:hypothetical protein
MGRSSRPSFTIHDTATQVIVSAVALDNAATAWTNSDQAVLDYLPEALVTEYRSAIDTAAANLIAPHLIDAWRERGYIVALTTADDLDPSPVSDETYHAVWDAAAGRIDPDELSRAALDGVRPSSARSYARLLDLAARTAPTPQHGSTR